MLTQRQQALVAIEPLEVTQRVWNLCQWCSDKKVELSDGTEVRLFQQFERELVAHRRRAVMDVLGLDEADMAIMILGARGLHIPNIAPLVCLSESGATTRKNKLGTTLGSSRVGFQSSLVGFFGLDEIKLIGS